MKSYGSIYKQELLKEIIPFWEKYSPDYIYGGYFTCLNSEGKVYDTYWNTIMCNNWLGF